MQKVRLFKLKDGMIVYDFPTEIYQGGKFVDDKTKPIHRLEIDYSKPIYSDAVTLGYKKEIIGYEQNEVLKGYEKRELTVEDCTIPEHLKDCEMSIHEIEEVQHLIDKPCPTYCEEFLHKDKIKSDDNWEKYIMPTDCVFHKHLNRLYDKMENCTNPLEIAKLQVKLEKFKKLDYFKNEKEIYEQALANMEEDGINKPEVKKKINDKIKGE